MERIEMRLRDGDCGIAVFAMANNLTYEASLNFFNEHIFDEVKKVPLVLKSQMEMALNLYGTKFEKISHKKKWENLHGDFCIIDANKKKFLWHWIIYVPEEKYIIDPRQGKPDKVFNIENYWLWGPAFSITRSNI